jgi:GH24 family phage-related lysozyme (muramidase)
MYLDDAVTAIGKFEGRIAWMYLDTLGNVTTGIGQMIPTVADALRYPFHKPSGEQAKNSDIEAEYTRVKQMQRGLLARAYRTPDALLLSDDDINYSFKNTLINAAVELTVVFPDYPEYPDPAKVALLDMRYNLGITKLRNEFVNFCAAVRQRRWPVAAQECHRADQPAARNQWAAEQFFLAGQ